MKHPFIKKLYIIISIVLLIVFLFHSFKKPFYKEALSIIGAEHVGSYAWTGVDTHGGMFGDGVCYLQFTLQNPDSMSDVIQNSNWNKLPVQDQRIINFIKNILQNLVWLEKISETKKDEILKQINQISYGSWFFLDRQSNSSETVNLDEAFNKNRYSHNIVIAFFDHTNGIIYYFSSDS